MIALPAQFQYAVRNRALVVARDVGPSMRHTAGRGLSMLRPLRSVVATQSLHVLRYPSIGERSYAVSMRSGCERVRFRVV